MSKITIQKGDVKTTLRPKNEGQELITQTISDIKESGLPTNEELDAFGDKLWDLLDVSRKNAPNTKTEKIVETTQEVVSNIKDFVQEKNYDGILQDIARKLKEGAREATDVKESTKEKVKSEAENIKDTLKNVAQMIFDLSKEMINDIEFRDMLVTILDITTNSYERASDQTSHLDVKEAMKSDIMTKPVPTDTKSDLSETSKTQYQYDFGKTGTTTQTTTNLPTTTYQPTTMPTTYQPTTTTQSTTYQPTTTTTQSTTYQTTTMPTTYKPTTTTPSTTYQPTTTMTQDFDKSSKNVTGTKTEEVVKEKIKQFGKYAELTDQEKDIILRKVSASLLRLKKHPEYQPLVRNIFKLYDDILNIWVKIENDPSLNNAYQEGESILHDIKKLIERASDMSLDHFIFLVKKLENIRNDQKYIDTRKDIEDLLFNQPYETEQDIKEKFENIKNDLKELNDKYENVLENLSQETKKIINGIGHDTQLSNITESVNQLVKDIFTDEHGRPTIEAATSSIGSIKDIFFPIIKKEFSYLVFPIIEVESKNYFFRIENFNLHIDHIIPDQLKIETDSKVQIDLDKGKRHGDFNFRLKFDEITTKVKNLKFLLRKKTGIKYNDHGEVNISVKDATIDIAFTFKLREDKVDKIEVSKIEVHLHGMKIDILESRHDVIDSIITSVFMPVVRAKVKKQIEDGLYDLLQDGLCKKVNEGLKNLEEQ